MKWLAYILILSLAVFAPRVVHAQEGDNAKLAEYKAPNIGTRLEYGGWSCTVEEVAGLRTLCRLADNSTVTLVGWLQIDGAVPDDDYFRERLYFYIHGAQKAYTHRIGLSDTDLANIESLWPLKLGNKTRYRVRVFAGLQFDVRVRVEAIQQLVFAGEEIETFVIFVDSRLRGDSSRQDFERRLWYSPELAFVVKEEFVWTKGSRRGQRFDSNLLAAKRPDGTPAFAFAPRPNGNAKQN